jgi:hypothetical protein
MGAILVLLLIAELGREIRWSTVTGLLAVVLLGLVLMANVAELRAGGRLFRAEGETNRATLAALELVRSHVNRFLVVEDEHAAHSHPDMFFPVWAYFEATEKYGSPAFSLDQLRTTGEQAREAADQEMVRYLAIETKPTFAPRARRGGLPVKSLSESDGRAKPVGSCLALIPDLGRTASFQVALPPGGFSYRTAPEAEVAVKLARFGDIPVTELPPVTGSAEVPIPTDRAHIPWRAEMRTGRKTFVCPR